MNINDIMNVEWPELNETMAQSGVPDDLFTKVYDTLVSGSYKIPKVLNYKFDRFGHRSVFTTYDEAANEYALNIQGNSEEELKPAIDVAKYYDLDYEIKKVELIAKDNNDEDYKTNLIVSIYFPGDLFEDEK